MISKYVFAIALLLLQTQSQLKLLDESYETGFITIANKPSRSIFYWLFHPQTKTPSPPLVIWFEHRPTCTGTKAAIDGFKGPFHFTEDHVLTRNPNSWNTLAATLYLDFPFGTGYSEIHDEKEVSRTVEELVADMNSLLQKFFSVHNRYKDSSIIFAGEGFAAQYVPNLALHLAESKRYKVKGIIMHSGVWDLSTQIASIPNFAKANNIITHAKSTLATITGHLHNIALKLHLYKLAEYFFTYTLSLSSNGFSVYVYNICKPKYNTTHFAQFFNDPEIQHELGTENHTWKYCREKRMIPIFTHSATTAIEKLLENGIPVFTSVGENDLLANRLGQEKWHHSLNWDGTKRFEEEKLKKWYIKGEEIAEYKKYKNFAYAVVKNEGHFLGAERPQFPLDFLFNFIISSDYP